MMLTLIVAQLVVSSTARPLSGAEAAAVLARLDSPSNWTNRTVCSDCDGPHVTIVPYRPGDGPFGPFPIYESAPLNCCSFYGTRGHQGTWNRFDRRYSWRLPNTSTANIGVGSRAFMRYPSTTMTRRPQSRR